MMNLSNIAEWSPGILTIFVISIIFLEWAYLTISNQEVRHKEGVISILSSGLAFLPLFIVTKLVLIGFMFWLYSIRIFDLGFQWYVWLACWLVYDFMFWLLHWLGHNVRLIWCLHSVHHTPKEMKLSVAFRGSFLDFTFVIHNILWLPLLGFHPLMVIIVESIGRCYGTIVHVSEKWFPDKSRKILEKLIITPSLHRVHHGVNPIYLDTNYGETFALWDLIFGTYQPELPEERPVYGTVKEIDSEDLLDTQTSEFRALWQDMKSASKLTDKIRYALKPPGWNHLDGGILASQLRNNSKK